MAGAAQATVITFTEVNARVDTVDVGTLGTINEPADNTALTSLSYIVSGLTIDDDGVNNDTATFTLAISATGTGDITWDNQAVPEFDYSKASFNGAGDGITFGDITVSGTGSGGLGYKLDSALYKEFTNEALELHRRRRFINRWRSYGSRDS